MQQVNLGMIGGGMVTLEKVKMLAGRGGEGL